MVEKETKKSDLTDNFSKFKSEFEPIFGKLEVLAEKAPDVYAHLVLSHGFMDHVSVTGLDEDVISRIKTEQGSFIPQNPCHDGLYWKYLKEKYLTWAKQHHLHEPLLELGWEEYRND